MIEPGTEPWWKNYVHLVLKKMVLILLQNYLYISCPSIIISSRYG